MAKRENREKDDFDSYEPDAFDNPPKGPSGVHRGRRSAAARFMPFVIVVLVAALCGWGAWGYFSGEAGNIRMPWSSSSSDSSSSDAAAKQAAAKKKAKAKAAKEAAAKKKAEEEAAQQAAQEQAAQEQAQQEQAAQEQAAQPDKTKSVRIINGTRTSGYAASKKTVLDQAGYTNVVAANPQGSLPSATVVWYADAADQATAQDVANTLGISNVQQASGLSSSVVVVLLS
ncbi:LytR C-terminal domain-containing protein [Bifidobacterium sp. CP2]|uniref:LytR C-terminal domain-containing protein n=1 Tax=Bifidobacterium sp. CP2 TaxID=2809025 RepID=UPI001BDC2816|nr:LytR C-terminal domain-containing protein [Bifidobacterium sp. CP2]MBT1180449.1 LytR C-terminal domain-containing protein [Bifidobacterium sp. CP2]